MTPGALRGMQRELHKQASLGATLARYARPIIMRAGGWSGAATGAAAGATANVAQELVSHGEDYSGAALRGAAGGALLGAAGGFSIGKARDIALATGKRGMGLAGEMGRRSKKSIGDWSKRQAHGVTGWTPKAGPKSIGLAGGAQKNQRAVAEKLRDARLKGVTDPKKRKKITEAASKNLKSIDKQRDVAKDVYKAGLTSLPGTVKGLVTNPKRLGKAVVKSVKNYPGGVAGAAVLPAAFTAADLASGAPLKEAIGGGVGDAAGMALTGGMPIVPQIAAWTALSEGGRAIGRAVRGKKRKTPRVSPPAPLPANMQPLSGETGG